MSPKREKLVPFRFKFRYLKILQSCNGLLLLECRSSPHGQKDYFICNPTTRKYRKLVLADETEDRVRGIFIVFDPAKSPYYKVFSFRCNEDWYYKCTVEVYDSETRTWSEKVKISDIPRQIINGVYWNDAIYFIRPRVLSCCFPFEDDSYEIHWFNGIPRVRSPGAKKNHVMESNGHLHYVVLSLHPGKNQVYVFERDADFGSWFLMYEVSLNPISVTFAGNNSISLLGMIRGQKEEDSVLLFHVPGKIMAYRFFDKNFEVLVDFTTESYFEEGQLQFLSKDAHQFIQTLAPV